MRLLKKGDVVTCKVAKVTESGVDVSINENITGFIKKVEISRERSEQRPNRFAPDEKLDAKITQIDKATRSVTLSIRALETQQAKAAMQAYGSTDSGASLGDILGAAIEEKQKKSESEKTEKKKPVSKESKKHQTKSTDKESKSVRKKKASSKEEAISLYKRYFNVEGECIAVLRWSINK